jgi:hypothetical protein
LQAHAGCLVVRCCVLRTRTVHVPAATERSEPVCVVQLYAVAAPVEVNRLPPGRSLNW